jgi:hypothetical protein
MPFQTPDQFSLADDDARLGPAQELISREKDQSHTGGDALLGSWLVGQSVGFGR